MEDPVSSRGPDVWGPLGKTATVEIHALDGISIQALDRLGPEPSTNWLSSGRRHAGRLGFKSMSSPGLPHPQSPRSHRPDSLPPFPLVEGYQADG